MTAADRQQRRSISATVSPTRAIPTSDSCSRPSASSNLKYATAMPPVPQRARPLRQSAGTTGTTMSETSRLDVVLSNIRCAVPPPLRLHTFNLTDQDLLFTYSRDLDAVVSRAAWYRQPCRRGTGYRSGSFCSDNAFACSRASRVGAMLTSCFWPCLWSSNWAVYAWTAVEMRFGSVLASRPVSLGRLCGDASCRGEQLSAREAASFSEIAAYVLVAMLLSGWVRDQSQQIREYRAARTKNVELRGAGDACCAPATDSATREAAFGPPA